MPLPDDILVPLAESETAIVNLLDSLPSIFGETKVNESCLGSAVRGAFMVAWLGLQKSTGEMDMTLGPRPCNMWMPMISMQDDQNAKNQASGDGMDIVHVTQYIFDIL